MPELSNLILAISAIAVVIFFATSVFGFGSSSADGDTLEKARELLAGNDARLIDVRTPQEYATNGLEGADNIPLQQLIARLDEVGPRDKPVVLYCRSGNRSAQAARLLQEQGFEEIYDLGAYGTARRIVDEAR